MSSCPSLFSCCLGRKQRPRSYIDHDVSLDGFDATTVPSHYGASLSARVTSQVDGTEGAQNEVELSMYPDTATQEPANSYGRSVRSVQFESVSSAAGNSHWTIRFDGMNFPNRRNTVSSRWSQARMGSLVRFCRSLRNHQATRPKNSFEG
jgi:dTDP-4-dehydrorhamnose reductase